MHISNVKLGTNMTYSGRDLETICRQVHARVVADEVTFSFVEPIEDSLVGTQLLRLTNTPQNKARARSVASLTETERRNIVGRNITVQDAVMILQSYTPTVKQSDIEEQIAYNKEMGKIHASLKDAISWLSSMNPEVVQHAVAKYSSQLNALQFPCGVNTTIPES
jgi:hypothetical protein